MTAKKFAKICNWFVKALITTLALLAIIIVVNSITH